MKLISDVIKKIMIKEPYYGLFLCSLNRKWSTEVPTAGVILRGINYELAVNKDWFTTLSPDERYGVIKHEVNK